MENMSMGRQSFVLQDPPVITSWASVAGKKEKVGPLGYCFDATHNDAYFGEKTWEQGEKRMQQMALEILAEKAGMKPSDFGVVFSGDLLNQCIATTFGFRQLGIPFLGLYGACSTMGQTLAMAALFVDSGAADLCGAVTSSHFCTAERQFRYPLEYGGQRTPTAQWTATCAGACLLECGGDAPAYVHAVTFGRVKDYGVTDINNMGAAMAPAAYDTLSAHFRETGRTPADYNLIVTGDLGQIGKELLMDLARKDGLSLGGKLTDCGTLVFDNTVQDVHAGGSGCGCSAITLCGELLGKLNSGKLKKILFCGTGALLSPTSTQQGLPIPGVCHAVVITGGRE